MLVLDLLPLSTFSTHISRQVLSRAKCLIFQATMPQAMGPNVTPISSIDSMIGKRDAFTFCHIQGELSKSYVLIYRWTTTPHTSIPGLTMAGSDAFLPAVCGAMYGGILGAVSILGYGGTLRFVFVFLSEFASSLQEENPKIGRLEAYLKALNKLGTEPVAN